MKNSDRILEKIHNIFIATRIILFVTMVLCVIAYPITMIFLTLNLAFAVTMVKIVIIVGCICIFGFIIGFIIDAIRTLL